MDLTLVPNENEPKHPTQGLYEKQMELLDTFLVRHAISQEQYDKSVAVLKAHFEGK